jgi:hypothetical protein
MRSKSRRGFSRITRISKKIFTTGGTEDHREHKGKIGHGFPWTFSRRFSLKTQMKSKIKHGHGFTRITQISEKASTQGAQRTTENTKERSVAAFRGLSAADSR